MQLPLLVKHHLEERFSDCLQRLSNCLRNYYAIREMLLLVLLIQTKSWSVFLGTFSNNLFLKQKENILNSKKYRNFAVATNSV